MFGCFFVTSGNMTKMTKIYNVLDECDEKVRNTLTGIKWFKGIAKCDPINESYRQIKKHNKQAH